MPRTSASRAPLEPEKEESPSFKDRAMGLLTTVLQSRPVRVVQHYTAKRGPILASGLAFQAIFAVFAALWIGFAIAGVVIATNLGLRDSLIDVLAQTVPGLITTDSQEGIVDPEDLLAASVDALSWQGAIAAVVLLLAALNWLASARENSLAEGGGLAHSQPGWRWRRMQQWRRRWWRRWRRWRRWR